MELGNNLDINSNIVHYDNYILATIRLFYGQCNWAMQGECTWNKMFQVNKSKERVNLCKIFHIG